MQGNGLNQTALGPRSVTILDLRGKGTLSEEEQELFRKTAPGRRTWGGSLILGDDPMLDEREELKLDREKKRIGCNGVVWLPDDELPPSGDSQIRLMLKLTELGVALGRLPE